MLQFNFFTIADGVTTEIFSLPTELNLVQKMSNGRLVTLGSNEKTVSLLVLKYYLKFSDL